MLSIKLYLVRHGITDWNIRRIFQGRENVPLNEEGISQAAQCGKALKSSGARVIVSSPLSRAYDTAKIIAAALNIGSVIVEADLTEREYGALSGAPLSNADLFSPDESAPGIEPLDQVEGRIMSVLEKYAALGSDTVMVSHGGAINAALRAITGGEFGTGKTRLKNASINIISFEGGKFTLAACNLTAEEYLRYKK